MAERACLDMRLGRLILTMLIMMEVVTIMVMMMMAVMPMALSKGWPFRDREHILGMEMPRDERALQSDRQSEPKPANRAQL